MTTSVLLLLAVLVILGVVILAVISRKPGQDSKAKGAAAPGASEADRIRFREWSSRAQRLEQEMVLLAGGKNGMVVLREAFRNPESPQMAEEYRESFLAKQRRLREACDEYEDLRRKAAALPEGSRRSLPPPADWELYEELLRETLS